MTRLLATMLAALTLVATLFSFGARRRRPQPPMNEGKNPYAATAEHKADERPTTERRNGKKSLAKKLLATVAVLALMVTVVSISVLALFTDTASVPANAFTTGTVAISTNPATALVTFSDMAPGDEVTNPITVTNDSTTLELRYAVTSTTTEDVLAAQLDLTIKSGVTTCTNAGFGTDGVVVYTTGDLGSMAGINVIGDPTTGAQGGDRTLAATANEVLCFNVLLPSSTNNTFQSLTSTATFAFQAEQTKNNP
ncbi:MAG: TasA family protein [Gemmatimonadales bacterium]